MVLQREVCHHGKTLCNLYHGTREFAHKADDFLTDYGEKVGRAAQFLSPAIAVANPVAGGVVGAVGVGLETYAAARNQSEE
jgi:hypothetical protein